PPGSVPRPLRAGREPLALPPAPSAPPPTVPALPPAPDKPPAVRAEIAVAETSTAVVIPPRPTRPALPTAPPEPGR
ncbi:MAG TPA: hypothetical protein VLH10_22235, partial [Yinghuangia sp.]|nr:hypothetical protein [Yinghuangia sp.]